MSDVIPSNIDLSEKIFRAQLFPHKDEILITSTFYNYWRESLEEESEFIALDPREKYFYMHLKGQGENMYFTGGSLISLRYGLTDQQTIEFYYSFEDVFRFRVFNTTGIEINYKIVRDVIQINSESEDDDSDSEDDDFNTISWSKTLKKKAVSGCKPLLIPANIVQRMPHIMPDDDQKYIDVIDEDLKSYKCKILVYSRSITERYIGNGWHGFCKENSLKIGDKLKFTYCKNLPDNLYVTIFRK